MPLAERLWNGVDRSDGPDACWLWQGYRKADGYGGIGSDNRLLSCHRLAWELTNGPIPDGLSVLHRCDVPLCCNPAHLFLGTNDENMADMVAKRRQASGERNGRAKLTVSDVVAIRHRYASGGASQAQIAREYGVHRMTILRLLNGRNWLTKNS